MFDLTDDCRSTPPEELVRTATPWREELKLLWGAVVAVVSVVESVYWQETATSFGGRGRNFFGLLLRELLRCGT